MKTKLLKKIRKRFTIKYYPVDKEYEVCGGYFSFRYYNRHFGQKEEAIKFILFQVKLKYTRYSLKYKNKKKQNQPVKVWYNDKNVIG